MASIRCGKCANTHTSSDAVRACYEGRLFTCHWLIEAPGHYVVVDEETGEADWIEGGVVDCNAEAIATERGWTCAAGHEHVTMQARHAEGWDYAHDAEEAKRLAVAGVDAVDMQGRVFVA